MTNKNLLGIHHVTAITSSAERNYAFMTKVLGMRLVKKTVNQDDIHTYHTFFADDLGSPGTDLTFFDFPGIPQGQHANNSITRIGLRVPDDAALAYYTNRLAEFQDEFDIKIEGEETLYGKKTLAFEYFDGQRYRIFSDENNQGIAAGQPWQNGPIPTDKAIYGLGPIEMTVSYYTEFKQLLQEIYGFKVVDSNDKQSLLEVAEGGNGGQILLNHSDLDQLVFQGYGEVHHVSFRVADHEALSQWLADYQRIGVPNSGLVDRFFFEALYARIGHILIELSTDGPGFMGDEDYEYLGETLSLPPFLEAKRQEIEQEIRHFDTSQPH
ncbi:ring-cleaving dioxygenase [Aerococcus kribbianus]|uniref:Ring-cleaving dioxygenase n=1 Tax=Aerococcus kribbianus TaxID=2999064 RepID=A0A9X3FLY1_9LACT|nr:MULTISPECIES: ring-cleaving dioxygenase [unclassified Aerococcus]MCZ0716925.1 ring-cleaving dioxygenase [Aerococcus sp. YH-aer221]MCZ0725213.1 ring-cleaving dioxygenase [Aerococcus sp. YH-aer222]